MHRFLRSVGFRTYIKKRDIEKMLSELEKTALRRRIEIDTDENLCELRAELAPGMGIVLVGMNREYSIGSFIIPICAAAIYHQKQNAPFSGTQKRKPMPAFWMNIE